MGKTPPNFSSDATKWYDIQEIRKAFRMGGLDDSPDAKRELLETKNKKQLTCDLTFKDVLDNKSNKEITNELMLQIADVLGYRYFVGNDTKIYEIYPFPAANAAETIATGLTRDDINEIL
jgi:hypothetical protein